MASDINRVVLVGRLTRDPDLRTTNTGTIMCRFSLAVNHSLWRKEEGNEERVYFFDCVTWGRRAEIINQYLKKGRRIGVEGLLTQYSWEDEAGNKRSKVEIQVDNFQFLDSKSAVPENAPSTLENTPENPPIMGAVSDGLSDEEVPF